MLIKRKKCYTLEPLNYTIDLTSKGDNYVVTDRYVFFGENCDTSGNGIIKINDGLFEFRLQNNVVTIGDEVSDYTSVEESEYNLLNYDALEESNLSKFYEEQKIFKKLLALVSRYDKI